jgi:hypothetical protein
LRAFRFGALFYGSLGFVIGGMQLPKRGSSGSYREFSLAKIYSAANASELNNNVTQKGRWTAAVTPMISTTTTPKSSLDLINPLL